MAITEEDLKELIEPKGDIEKLSSISSDGRALLTRIPKELVEELNLKKGDKLIWALDKGENRISLVASGAAITKV